MFIHWLTLLISLLFVNIHTYVNKPQHLSLAIVEHKENDLNTNYSLDQSRKTTTEKTLIRYDQMN